VLSAPFPEEETLDYRAHGPITQVFTVVMIYPGLVLFQTYSNAITVHAGIM